LDALGHAETADRVDVDLYHAPNLGGPAPDPQGTSAAKPRRRKGGSAPTESGAPSGAQG
jgi:hypothetical protein